MKPNTTHSLAGFQCITKQAFSISHPHLKTSFGHIVAQ